MELFERLKELRKIRGLSQSEMAQNIGITQSAYSRYETGEKKPMYDNLLKIARFFDVTTDYLLGNMIGEAENIPREVLEKLESYKKYLMDEWRNKNK